MQLNIASSDPPQRHHQRNTSKKSLHDDINTDSHLFESQLLLLALGTGIQDAVIYPVFGCFVSNQTGNTVVFAVDILSRKNPSHHQIASKIPIPAIGVSLGVFIAGCLCTAQFANHLGVVKRRWWILASSLLQSCLLVVVAVLLYEFPNEAQASTHLGLLTVALLAFSAGAQTGMVRALGITDITTAMATAAWVDILIDPRLWVRPAKNRARNRRIGFLVFLVAGSFIGATAHSYVGSGFAIILALVVRLVAMGLCFVVGKVQDVDGEMGSALTVVSTMNSGIFPDAEKDDGCGRR